MATRVLRVDPESLSLDAVREAAACLAGGGLVVIPTETVYGLAANVIDPKALARLRAVKGREAVKPFTVHIGSRQAVERFVPDLTGLARRLVQKAWPGPLTVVFPVVDPRQATVIRDSAEAHIPSIYHERTVGIRCPDDRVAAAVLTEAGVPVVAASANPAGAPAPVTAEEALDTLADQVDLVLDAGRTRYAKPSTIIRLNGDGYELIREGMIAERTLQKLCRVNFLAVCTGNTCRSPMAEALLRRLLAERLGIREAELVARGYYVESAGVSAMDGMRASEPAVAVMKARGMDVSGHRSSTLTLEAIARADYIFAMTPGHLRAVTRMSPAAAERCRLLDDDGIEDPVGGDEAEYARCAEAIENALRRKLQEISL